MQKIIFLQMNEINFEFIERYIEMGKLPMFADFFRRYGFVRTTSESEHKNANPWIQWPTVHTGLDYDEHGIFRLGDVVDTDHEHIYERLEAHGLSVAALFPFNAENKTQNPAFFVPDPWTQTPFSGSWDLRLLYDAAVQVTDDYANERIALKSILGLLLAGAVNINWSRLPDYVCYAWGYRRKRWYRALFFDRFVADTLMTQWRRHRPDFTTVFMNAGAHLQHHYMCSAAIYDGDRDNPSWYVGAQDDPTLDAYELYDTILGDLLGFCEKENVRLWVGTGLQQVPHERESIYYRLDEHEVVLDTFKIPYQAIHPLMTEDFVVSFASAELAREGQRMLEAVRADADDVFYVETADVEVRSAATHPHIFYVDNRGTDLYVQLKPTARLIPAGLSVSYEDKVIESFDRLVSFVQIKNGHHVGVGYFADTGCAKDELPGEFPLRDMFSMVLDAFGLPNSELSQPSRV